MPHRSTPRRTAAQHFQALYVRIMLRMLPHLITLLRHPSRRIQAETNYLPEGYTFMLRVDGTDLSCACQRADTGAFKRVRPTDIARDVEPGSGLASSDPNATYIDYVIAFRSLAYAFACFSGGMTLKDALAERAFSTRGPNNTGVALTYMFTALLKMFFGWRSAYRGQPLAESAAGR